MIEIAKNKVEIGKNIYRLIKEDGTYIENPVIDGLKVEFMGRMGGVVEIEEGSIFRNVTIYAGGAAYIHIKRTHSRGISNTIIRTACPCRYKYLFIDEGCSIESANITMVDDNDLVLTIGKNCMFSSNISVRAADGHTIFEVETNKILNRAEPIIIGDHVWVGAGSTLLKGAQVPSDSIVGIQSLVTKPFFDKNVAIAGVPAKVVKTGINWNRARIFEFEKK